MLRNNIDSLRMNEWDQIESFIQIYKPFDSAINQLSREEKTTISSIFSLISYLKHHLKKLF